jgi:hypothetical protein
MFKEDEIGSFAPNSVVQAPVSLARKQMRWMAPADGI